MSDWAGFWIGLSLVLCILKLTHAPCGQPSIKQAIVYKLTAVKSWEAEQCGGMKP